MSFSVDFDDLGKRKYFLNQKAPQTFIEHVLGTSVLCDGDTAVDETGHVLLIELSLQWERQAPEIRTFRVTLCKEGKQSKVRGGAQWGGLIGSHSPH